MVIGGRVDAAGAGVRTEDEVPTTSTVSPSASVVRATTVVLVPVPIVMGWPGASVWPPTTYWEGGLGVITRPPIVSRDELGVAAGGVIVEDEVPTTNTVAPAEFVVRATTVVLAPVPRVIGCPGARVWLPTI